MLAIINPRKRMPEKINYLVQLDFCIEAETPLEAWLKAVEWVMDGDKSFSGFVRADDGSEHDLEFQYDAALKAKK